MWLFLMLFLLALFEFVARQPACKSPMRHSPLLSSKLSADPPSLPFPELLRKLLIFWLFCADLDCILSFSSTNFTHTVVVRPLEGIRGRFNFTAGEITYLSEGSADVQIGYTSEPGEGFIVSLKEFNKLFSPHYVSYIDLKFSDLQLTHSYKHTVRLGRIPAHLPLNGAFPLFPVELQQEQVRSS